MQHSLTRPLYAALAFLTVACGKDTTELILPDRVVSDGVGGTGSAAELPDASADGGSSSLDGEGNGSGLGGSSGASAGSSGAGGSAGQGLASDAGWVPPIRLVSGLTSRPTPVPFLSLPARLDLRPRGWDVDVVFPALSFTGATFIQQEATSQLFFVAEREGRIWAFENRADVAEKKLVLDITRQCQGRGDRGLVGFAFHPEFGQPGSPNRGFVYLHYPFVDPAILEGPAPANVPSHSRLSRFTIDLDTMQADVASELVLIDQYDENLLHLGGASFFRPSDGYLYLTVGDEGLACSVSGNCGRNDKDLFSGVLRIDVDPTPDADSHAIPRQPEQGTTANYTIPNDNPFVGQAGALEEFYALGLRSPHRMTVDPVDDIVWLGDVGGVRRDELDVLQSGANYQWDYSEGLITRRPRPVTAPGIWTNPVLDFARDEIRVIIGGYVYRGQRFPQLSGRYVFGDFNDNAIWALDYTYDGLDAAVQQYERLARQVGGRGTTLTSFGVDTQGELYITSLGVDRIKTLVNRAEGRSNLPATLSATGVFADVAALAPAPGLLAYDVQSPLWSDGASKQRWISLPPDTHIGFSENEPWVFPPGTVFVKHFSMLMDERDPSSVRRLETRVLVAQRDGRYYGASYKWNTEQTDAAALLESETELLEVVASDGSLRQQSYFYPGPRDCTTCHNPDAQYVLGVRTAQLNGDALFESTGIVANQLYTWSEIGMFDRRLAAEDIVRYPKLAALADETRSEAERISSYWDSNCSMCHGRMDGIRAEWDARFEVAMARKNVILAASVNSEGAFIVVPGDPDASILLQRDSTTDPELRMPPLARNRTDEAYIELLRRWIRSLDGASPQ